MRFQAKLVNVPNLPKPIENLSMVIDTAVEWGKEIVKNYPKGKVEIYEMEPTLRCSVIAVISGGKAVSTVVIQNK